LKKAISSPLLWGGLLLFVSPVNTVEIPIDKMQVLFHEVLNGDIIHSNKTTFIVKSHFVWGNINFTVLISLFEIFFGPEKMSIVFL